MLVRVVPQRELPVAPLDLLLRGLLAEAQGLEVPLKLLPGFTNVDHMRRLGHLLPPPCLGHSRLERLRHELDGQLGLPHRGQGHLEVLGLGRHATQGRAVLLHGRHGQLPVAAQGLCGVVQGLGAGLDGGLDQLPARSEGRRDKLQRRATLTDGSRRHLAARAQLLREVAQDLPVLTHGCSRQLDVRLQLLRSHQDGEPIAPDRLQDHLAVRTKLHGGALQGRAVLPHCRQHHGPRPLQPVGGIVQCQAPLPDRPKDDLLVVSKLLCGESERLAGVFHRSADDLPVGPQGGGRKLEGQGVLLNGGQYELWVAQQLLRRLLQAQGRAPGLGVLPQPPQPTHHLGPASHEGHLHSTAEGDQAAQHGSIAQFPALQGELLLQLWDPRLLLDLLFEGLDVACQIDDHPGASAVRGHHEDLAAVEHDVDEVEHVVDAWGAALGDVAPLAPRAEVPESPQRVAAVVPRFEDPVGRAGIAESRNHWTLDGRAHLLARLRRNLRRLPRRLQEGLVELSLDLLSLVGLPEGREKRKHHFRGEELRPGGGLAPLEQVEVRPRTHG
mmetsp:Transcript_24292/g.77060  ORF Transcript_24292/g.77060 Transcript_24292/m.77060 type:complete len:555 (+) Transcript_24292:348-2012(+)